MSINNVTAEAIVDAVLRELGDRAGFDSWWDDMDEGTRYEIRKELIKKVKETAE